MGKISFFDYNRMFLDGRGTDICDNVFDMLNYMDSSSNERCSNKDDFYILCNDQIAKELYLDDDYYAKDNNGIEMTLGELTAKDTLSLEEALMLSKIIYSIKLGNVVCVQVTKWIMDHKEVFDNFMKDNNSENYQPYYIKSIDDVKDDFYDIYIQTWLSLINGQYSDEDYESLYYALIQKNKEVK